MYIDIQSMYIVQCFYPRFIQIIALYTPDINMPGVNIGLRNAGQFFDNNYGDASFLGHHIGYRI